MSSYTVERVLFDIQSKPDLAERLATDPDGFLDSYPLSPIERTDIQSWNVRALSDQGVSDMLLMLGFTSMHGPHAMPEYLRRMNMPPVATAA